MPSIDLNCDLGESFGAYTIGMDAENFALCDQREHRLRVPRGRPVRNAKERSAVRKKYGVQVGAHPGLPDLQGFGRREWQFPPPKPRPT